jgi:hypothetical protein
VKSFRHPSQRTQGRTLKLNKKTRIKPNDLMPSNKDSRNMRSHCKSIDDARNPKDKACHSTSFRAFEIPVFEPNCYHIYRRLKAKQVGFKELYSARYSNISNLLMLRMTLWKLFS